MAATKREKAKTPSRTQIINFLLQRFDRDTVYLEVGVCNPAKNYDKISAATKYSVDPGLEFVANPVDFPLNSDVFFEQLATGEILSADQRFDVIFIDGLHLAEQVDRDVANALRFIREDGFLVLHDCNPPTAWHAREDYHNFQTPAGITWNGTTWKAFLKWRGMAGLQSCCIDSDWGVGILSKTRPLGPPTTVRNPFYEFSVLDRQRQESLNLIDFATLQDRLSG
jgi:hypothetical protein